jgi:hypothetical protein
MRARSLAALVAAVAVSVTLAACGATDSTAPTPPAASAPTTAPDAASTNLLTTLLGSPQNITPVHRNTPLARSITVSKRIGILGGTIAIPEAGVSIVVPPLAIPAAKTISVTAMAGDKVAYEFAPHGLKFTLPLVMTQNMSKTDASGGLLGLLDLKVGYFPDSNNPTSVTELLGVQVNVLNQTTITTLWHFSGYIFAGGRDSDSF